KTQDAGWSAGVLADRVLGFLYHTRSRLSTSAPAQARENDTEGLASQRRNIHHRRTSGGPMPHYRYLIVGAGMTGDAAVRGIREIDSSGPIGVIALSTSAHSTTTGACVNWQGPDGGLP